MGAHFASRRLGELMAQDNNNSRRKKTLSTTTSIIISTVVLCLLWGQQAKAGYDGDFGFSGTIQSLPGTPGFIGNWMVSGRIVTVNASTKIDRDNNAQIAVGARAEIEGFLQNDGSVIA